MDQNIGKMLDNRYELLEVIGSGGMSVVYKAKCHRLNRMVAVKILRSEFLEDADFRRRFRDESQAVAMLSHPNIVSVYDVSRSGDMEYIVMELIDGITLKQYMEKREQLNWREALHFITQVMRGLSHAHSRGIVHRDIKPHNLMVLRDGSVKIADFGIACLANTTTTLTQEALGSVHYISPEQARGERVTARSDIYSAGVVLYEMLTSHLPFEGDSAVAVALQHISSIPLSPRELNPEIPEALELICMKAMTADASKRYSSADEMIAALEEFRKNPDLKMDFTMSDLQEKTSDEPTMPLPVSRVNDLSRKVKKNTAEKLDLDADDDDEDDEDAIPYRPKDPKGKKKRTLAVIGGAVLALVLLVSVGKMLLSSFLGGNDTYVVPSVVGMTEEEAAETEGVKDIFVIKVVGSHTSTEVPAGKIVEQDPGRGSRKKLGSTIEVYVSAGSGSDEMPNLVGEEYQKAKVTLLNMNLDLQINDSDAVYNEDVPQGCIISTIPDAGESLERGNSVYLLVSLGPEPVPVTVLPLIGETEEKARAMAEEMGLTIGEVTRRDDIFVEEGIVIEQSINPGDVVDSGTTINIVVSSGRPAGSVTRRYRLPWWSEDKVHVVIELNDTVVYDEVVSTSMGSVNYTFSGKGDGHVKVYFDDVLTTEEDIKLS